MRLVEEKERATSGLNRNGAGPPPSAGAEAAWDRRSVEKEVTNAGWPTTPCRGGGGRRSTTRGRGGPPRNAVGRGDEGNGRCVEPMSETERVAGTAPCRGFEEEGCGHDAAPWFAKCHTLKFPISGCE
jgi:hypothetical protein